MEFLNDFQCWDLGSKDLGLLPIYLEKEACFITKKYPIKIESASEEINVSLFLDSSYILPVDYSRIDDKRIEEKLQLDSKIETIKSKIEALYNYKKIQLETLRAGKQIDEFKNKLKDGEFKIVQIVALFVTIASFVLMQVKIYDNKSGIESIAITISLAGILVLFNGVFQWMIEGRREPKSGWKHLCAMVKTPVIFVSILLLASGGILFIYCKYKGWDMDSQENRMLQEKVTVLKETERMRMDLKNYKYKDSMQKIEQNKKIDSINKARK